MSPEERATMEAERDWMRREIKNYDRVVGAFTLPRSVRGPAKVKRHNLIKAVQRLDRILGPAAPPRGGAGGGGPDHG